MLSRRLTIATFALAAATGWPSAGASAQGQDVQCEQSCDRLRQMCERRSLEPGVCADRSHVCKRSCQKPGAAQTPVPTSGR